MGDEVDTFNLPQHQSQSGNFDSGHISSLAENIQEAQAGQLNTALENYYGTSGTHDYHRLRESLVNLGYSNERVDQIAQSANMEFALRSQNHGEPSDLTPNQLQFLRNQHDPSGRGLALNLQYRHIHTDENGRQYIDDNRVRQVDGTPSRLYLPRAVPFDPLTGEQREEVDYLTEAERQIHIQDNPDRHAQTQLTDQQREEIMYLATQYLNSDPQFREAQRLQFRSNVQQIQGLDTVENVREDLLELFVDIDDEYNYRQENDGQPRNLSEDQLAFLRREGLYNGQPILEEQDSGIFYFYSNRGKTPIPSDSDIARLQDIQPTYQELEIRPTQSDYEALSGVFADFLGGRSTFLETQQRIQEISQYNPRDPIRDPYRFSMYREFEANYDLVQQEKEFRDLNDGRPSQLSELQYEWLLNHASVSDQEERYNDQIIYTAQEYPYNKSYMMSNGVYMGIPSDEYINGFIEQGLYVRPEQPPEQNQQLDDSNIPDFRDARIISAIGQEDYDNLTDEQLEILRGVVNRKGDLVRTYDSLGLDQIEVRPQVIFTAEELRERQRAAAPVEQPYTRPRRPGEVPVGDILTELAQGPIRGPIGPVRDPAQAPGLIPEAPPGFEPPVIPGGTQPINLRTGEDIPVPTPEQQVLRYQRYFNDNQALYVNFRNTFRNILPVLSGITSSYIAYSYVSVRNKNTLRNIINDEYDLIRQLEGRIERANQELASLERSGAYRQYQERGFLTDQQEKLIEKYTSLRAGLDPKEIGEASVIRRSIDNVESRLSEINTNLESLEKLTDRLNRDVDNSRVYTTLINNQLEEIINTDYSVLENLKQYAPSILSGFSVGYTLGLVLSGYLFPTYMSINEPFITADNIEYDKRDKKTADIKSDFDKEGFSDEPNHVPVPAKEYEPNKRSRIITPYKETFRPVKHGKRPLKYDEIQELKSTLTQSELNMLKNKFLHFDEDKLIMDQKTDDKCKNVVGETQITKRKLF